MKQLKILHLTTHLNIGGITSYLLLLSKALVKEGHSVAVFSSGGEVSGEFEKAGIKTVTFPIKTKNEFNPKLFWLMPRIIQWVKKEGFDCLHAHTRVTQVLAFFISKATGLPVVTTAHGFFKPRLSRRVLSAWGDRVIAISPLVAQDLQDSHLVDLKRIRKVTNAVDSVALEKAVASKNIFQAKKDLHIPEKSFVLVSVSRLVEDKGHAILLEAAAKISPMYPDIFVLIVGEGREKENLEEKIKSLGLSQKVRIAPDVKDMASVYAVMDIFVHPATYREGFGLAMAEAMSAGKPVLVTDIPATNTLIYDGENGFMVPAKDVEGLAHKINFIREHPVETRAVAERGRAWVKDIASLERFTRETRSVYEELVK